MDYSLPGSSVHGISQARILERVAFPSPWDLPDPGIEPASPVSPALAGGGFFTTKPPDLLSLQTLLREWRNCPDFQLFLKVCIKDAEPEIRSSGFLSH